MKALASCAQAPDANLPAGVSPRCQERAGAGEAATARTPQSAPRRPPRRAAAQAFSSPSSLTTSTMRVNPKSHSPCGEAYRPSRQAQARSHAPVARLIGRAISCCRWRSGRSRSSGSQLLHCAMGPRNPRAPNADPKRQNQVPARAHHTPGRRLHACTHANQQEARWRVPASAHEVSRNKASGARNEDGEAKQRIRGPLRLPQGAKARRRAVIDPSSPKDSWARMHSRQPPEPADAASGVRAAKGCSRTRLSPGKASARRRRRTMSRAASMSTALAARHSYRRLGRKGDQRRDLMEHCGRNGAKARAPMSTAA